MKEERYNEVMEKKVSIVTPCYNGERFLNTYFKSLLEQTYTNIEVIFIDDGSIDKTEEIVKEYQQSIKKKGIEFYYVKKENEGMVSALNCGFKRFSGEFLSWIDVDDYMHPDYISKKVELFEQNPDIDILITRVAYIKTAEPDKIIGYSWNNPPKDRNDFVRRILLRDGVGFEPGNHMVKTKSFRKYIPSLEIYDGGKKVGGQIQLLLPMVYYGKFMFENVCLYDYYIHENNHHEQFKSIEQWNNLFVDLEKVYFETIKRLNCKEEVQLMETVIQAIEKEKFELSLKYESIDLLKSSYIELKKRNIVKKRHKMIYIICKNNTMIRLYNKIRKILYRL